MINEDFVQLVGKLQEKAQRKLPIIKTTIDVFISKKITDKIEIEHALDTLLDYVLLDVGKEEFKRLNKYYESVNKDHADFYWHSYRDLLDLE